MRVGINEVIIHGRSTGTRQREFNLLPELLQQIEERKWNARIYVSRHSDQKIIQKLTGVKNHPGLIQTPVPATPTYQRLTWGLLYWQWRTRHDQLDVFHTSYYPVPRLAVPTVLTVNDLRFVHLPKTYRPWRRLFLKLMVKPSLLRASRIITISNHTKEVIVGYFKVPADKIDVVHIPADPRFHPVTEKIILDRARQRYSLPEQFILFVGHIEPRKNLKRIIKAFRYLQATEQLSHKLVIVGVPSFDFESVVKKVDQYNLTDNIILTGYVADEDMPAVYTMADILVFPSLYEGFGVPVIEAMACGTPVITSNITALPEVAGNAAILVDPYSVEMIATGIMKLLNDKHLYTEMVHKGLKRAKQFGAREAATATCRAYQNAVKA